MRAFWRGVGSLLEIFPPIRRRRENREFMRSIDENFRQIAERIREL